MFNRENWILTKEYLEHRLNVDLITIGSLNKEKTHLRFVLEWAQETPFSKAEGIRPSLPEYLKNSRLDDKEGQISDLYIKKILSTTRRFFTWLNDYKTTYKKIKPIWIKTVKTKRINNIPRTSEVVSLQEIIKIADANVYNLVDQRSQAMAVFLFLSGIRIGAFVSLPIKAVDIENRTILQYPSLGVRTKNGKYAKTFLWNIPELIPTIKKWDELVRSTLPDNGFWFAPFSPLTGEIDKNNLSSPKTRISLARTYLKTFLEKIDMPYHSPHKFRHGHIQYGMEHCRNVADYKAVSENVMHADISTTDQFYSNHGDEELKNRLDEINNNQSKMEDNEELFREFELFLAWKEAKKQK